MTVLSWKDLTHPKMLNEEFLLLYPNDQYSDFQMEAYRVAEVETCGNIDTIWAEGKDNSILTITKDGKGTYWEAYKIINGF